MSGAKERDIHQEVAHGANHHQQSVTKIRRQCCYPRHLECVCACVWACVCVCVCVCERERERERGNQRRSRKHDYKTSSMLLCTAQGVHTHANTHAQTNPNTRASTHTKLFTHAHTIEMCAHMYITHRETHIIKMLQRCDTFDRQLIDIHTHTHTFDRHAHTQRFGGQCMHDRHLKPLSLPQTSASASFLSPSLTPLHLPHTSASA